MNGFKTIKSVPVLASGAVQLAVTQADRTRFLLTTVGATGFIYLGNNSNVTTSTGFPWPCGTPFEDDDSRDDWWAISPSGTIDTRVIITQ